LYIAVALTLLIISGTGHMHLLNQLGDASVWWQNYGLGLLAGICWLVVGGILLGTARDWPGAVEGFTLLPPAMLLLLLYSNQGNVQQSDPTNAIFQLIWVPSFALLGAAFIHLSLIYRPKALLAARSPRIKADLLPYLPVLALITYEWLSYLILGYVPMRLNLDLSLGYAAVGGVIGLFIALHSLLCISNILPLKSSDHKQTMSLPPRIRRRAGNLLTLWIVAACLGFCLGVLPILLSGRTLLPLPMLYLLMALYPLILWYTIRSQRLVDSLYLALDQKGEEQHKLEQTAAQLRQSNNELQHATSLLLQADAHLRSLLSQRIHDQPKQQALRIRSLLAHWQYKLHVEAERDANGKVAVQPIIEVLSKVRKISEELEGDLRGLQLLVEDVYQRRSLGLRQHLEKLIREDLPALHPESPLKVRADLWALDTLDPNLERTKEGTKIAEAISYTVTQALLNVYHHAGANFATVRTTNANGALSISIHDDGHGFDINAIPFEKTSLFKARLKARETGGWLTIESVPRSQIGHGTTVILHLPLPQDEQVVTPDLPLEASVQDALESPSIQNYH
jgi:signal transduction histidine kinase